MRTALKRRTICHAAVASLLPLIHPLARASQFPDRAIRLIVGFAPGGPTDATARVVARLLERELGQSVIVDNKPGAGQTVAMQSTVNGGADGYTLIVGNPGGFSVGPNLYKSLAYDSRQFVPVAPLTTQANILVALPSFPASSLSELVALAKSRKLSLNYGTLGAGSSVHLAMEMFKKRTGLVAEHIPYRGEAPAILAVKAKEVELGAITAFGALPRIRNGELKALGVFQAKPVSYLPEVQTTAQAGYPDVDLTSWLGLFAPPRTPKTVTDKLEAAARRVLKSQEFAAYISSNALEPLAIENTAFLDMIQKQTRQLGEIIDSIGLKPE